MLEEARAHSRILASRIPWTEEPGGLQSTICGVTESQTQGGRDETSKATFPPTHLVLPDSTRLRPQALRRVSALPLGGDDNGAGWGGAYPEKGAGHE